MSSLGILSDPSLPLPYLLDAINHAEVGHLPRAQQLTAVSDRGAQGPYQFLTKNLHDMGYGMPRDIPVSDITNYNTARDLAGQYVTGYSQELGFKTPLEQLVAYTAGPQFAADWVARGANIEELGPRTQSYIKRAAAYLNENYNEQQQDPKMMSDYSYFGIPISGDIAQQLQSVHDINKQRLSPQAAAVVPFFENQLKPSTAATAVQENILEAMQNGQMQNTGSNAPAPLPALTEVRSPDQIRQQYNSTAVPMPDPGAGGTGSGILVSRANASEPYYDQNGVLNIPITEGTPTGRRDVTPLAARTPPPPQQQQRQAMMQPPRGNINDLMIAMGAAGLRGSAEGGLQGLAGMGEAYTAYKAAEQDAIAKYNASLAKGGKGKKGSGNAAANLPYAKAALDAINTIEQYVNDQGSSWWPFNDVTGPVGAALSYVAGTPAHNVAMQIDTIEAAIGFDRLQAMRDASPTGGALGQVSEMELTLLKSSLGSLRQSQTQDEFMRNLRAVQRHYEGAVEAIERQQQAYQQGMRAPAAQAPAASAAPAQPGTADNNNLSAADAIVGIN